MSPTEVAAAAAVLILTTPLFARAQCLLPQPQPVAPVVAVTMTPQVFMAPTQPVYAQSYQQPLYGAAAVTAPQTIVVSPGPISRSLARFGRRLEGFGNTRVWTVNRTTLTPVQVQVQVQVQPQQAAPYPAAAVYAAPSPQQQPLQEQAPLPPLIAVPAPKPPLAPAVVQPPK
jgi:hypothetical protein